MSEKLNGATEYVLKGVVPYCSCRRWEAVVPARKQRAFVPEPLPWIFAPKQEMGRSAACIYCEYKFLQ